MLRRGISGGAFERDAQVAVDLDELDPRTGEWTVHRGDVGPSGLFKRTVPGVVYVGIFAVKVNHI
jgi:hypothetical protein